MVIVKNVASRRCALLACASNSSFECSLLRLLHAQFVQYSIRYTLYVHTNFTEHGRKRVVQVVKRDDMFAFDFL